MKKRLSLFLSLIMVLGVITSMPLTVNAATTPVSVSSDAAYNKIYELYDILGGFYFNTTQSTACGAKSSGHGCTYCQLSSILAQSWFINKFGSLSVNQFPITYYSDGSTHGPNGKSCFGFASFAEWYIYKTASTDKVTTEYIGSFSYDYSTVASTVQTGDLIRGDDSHSAIVISYDSTGVTVLDSNYEGSYNCQVNIHKIKYSKYNSFSISRAQNASGIRDLSFVLNEDKQSYSISSSDFSISGELVIPDIYNGLPITDIWAYAFKDRENLISLTISDNIKNIGDYAFYGCTNLESITIGNGVSSIGISAFSYCDSITSITIPDSVINIGVRAFYGCSNLSSITISDNVVNIGKYVFDSTAYFDDSSNWEHLSQHDRVLYVGNHFIEADFYSADYYEVKNGTRTISENAFYSCENLKTVVIPSSVRNIGYAFSDCPRLESISVDENNLFYTSIEGVLFNKNKTVLVRYPSGKINEVYTIPDGVTRIGYSAFDNCINLTAITISDSVSSIGDGVFSSCNNLLAITIPDSVKEMGNSVFWYCSSLESANIGKNVSGIGSNVFMHCQNLKSVNLGESITSIGDSAFYFCTNLNSIVIPEGVTSIGESSFEECTNLMSVVIPTSVRHIEERAFFDCDNLKSVKLSSNVSNIGEYALGFYFNDNAYCERKISGYTIYGIEGTVAETYANTHGFTFINTCAHISTKWLTDKKATVNAAGKKHKECTECGEVLETATIKQLKCNAPKITAIANKSYGVRFVWNKVDGADSYIVYRKVSGGSYKYLGKTTKTAYADKTAKSGTKYYYVVKAVNEAGNSEKSASKGITFVGAPVIKTPSSAKSGITVKWGKVTGAEGYIVYRKTGSGSYERIAKVSGGTKVSYLDKTAKKGKTYSYKVFAYKGSTKSVGSAVKTIKDKY